MLPRITWNDLEFLDHHRVFRLIGCNFLNWKQTDRQTDRQNEAKSEWGGGGGGGGGGGDEFLKKLVPRRWESIVGNLVLITESRT